MSRRLVVELNDRTAVSLDARCEAEGLNKTTIANRAVQVYALLAAHQDTGGRIVLERADGTSETLRLV